MAIVAALALMAHAATAPRKATGPSALGNVGTWFSARDYPQEAMVKRQQGTVGFQLDVDPNGLPSDCKIIQSSGVKLLDDRTCTIMMARARFRPVNGAGPSYAPAGQRKRGKKAQPVDNSAMLAPALAGSGPIRYFRHAMVWKLPGRQEEKLVDRSFDAASTISSTGEVLTCKLTGAGASKIATAGGSCGPFGNRDFFSVFLKDEYRKVRATNVRMVIVANGAPIPPTERPPNFQRVLAKADIDIAASGEMTQCTSIIKLEQLGHTMDLCEFVRADPPRFPSGAAGRKATIMLDISAYFT